MKEYIKALQNISGDDWIKLRTSMDRYFEKKLRESYKNIKLTDTDKIENIIRSQFGGTLD